MEDSSIENPVFIFVISSFSESRNDLDYYHNKLKFSSNLKDQLAFCFFSLNKIQKITNSNQDNFSKFYDISIQETEPIGYWKCFSHLRVGLLLHSHC